jgi:hypothetical protein
MPPVLKRLAYLPVSSFSRRGIPVAEEKRRGIPGDPECPRSDHIRGMGRIPLVEDEYVPRSLRLQSRGLAARLLSLAAPVPPSVCHF